MGSDPQIEGFLALLAARRAPRTVEAYRRDLAALATWLGRPPHTVTTEELEDRLGDPRLVLLDARPENRYRGEVLGPDPVPGHIPGARHVELSGDPASLPQDVLQADEIVCYCGSGVASCVPLLALHRAGRTDARLYPGSWSEWSRKGLPAER